MSLNSLAQRLRNKIEVDDNGCWLWTGSRHPSGYGQVSDGKKPRRAHRYIYELLVGPIPNQLHLDHLCRVVQCVNPAHLEPVSFMENTQRAVQSRTHCKNGHPRTPANLQKRAIAGGPHRHICLVCKREWARKKKAQ